MVDSASRGAKTGPAAADRADICAYADRKTGFVYPDLCETLANEPAIRHYWEKARGSGTAKAVSFVGLGLVSLLSTSIAMSNLEHNFENCVLGIFSEKDCEEKPVAPFYALGGLTFFADLVILFIPNQNLHFARQVTRDHYRDLLRNPPVAPKQADPAASQSPPPVHPEPIPPPSMPGMETAVDSTASKPPDSLGSTP